MGAEFADRVGAVSSFRENTLKLAEQFERRARHAESEAVRHRQAATDLRTRLAVEEARGGTFEPGWYERAALPANTIRGTCSVCGAAIQVALVVVDREHADAAVRDICAWMEAHYTLRHPSNRRPFDLEANVE